MEKDSRKNQKIHKNVGLFKSTIERKTRIKIREKENRLGRSLTREEKAKLRHKVTHDFQTQLAVRIGAVSLIGLTFFSAGKMLNEGSGRIEGVSQENDNSVTIQANNFREGLKVVGLGDEGILIVQDENGQDVQITNENVKSIKEQNDLMAQREAERNKIKEDIKSIGSEKDTLEYMKKFYKEQYAKTNGKELPGNITIEFFNRDLNPTTIEEIVVKDARGEVVDSWKDSVESKDGSTLSTIGGSLMQIEQLRKYYRDSSPDSYLSRKGGEKDQLAEFLIKASGLEEQQNQKSEGMEPGE
ncbi:MAG: hypothetical protein ACLR1U_02685 [Clostridia bacterium]|jgi:hypothetical protein|nr:hypothetical protein [Clostridium sp.]